MTSLVFIFLVSKVQIDLIKKMTWGLFNKNAEEMSLIEISYIIYILILYVAFIISVSHSWKKLHI